MMSQRRYMRCGVAFCATMNQYQAVVSTSMVCASVGSSGTLLFAGAAVVYCSVHRAFECAHCTA